MGLCGPFVGLCGLSVGLCGPLWASVGPLCVGLCGATKGHEGPRRGRGENIVNYSVFCMVYGLELLRESQKHCNVRYWRALR